MKGTSTKLIFSRLEDELIYLGKCGPLRCALVYYLGADSSFMGAYARIQQWALSAHMKNMRHTLKMDVYFS